MPSQRATQNPALHAKISQMSLSLAPLVSMTNGQAHPSFPSTLLKFWLLTSDQCDELAHFYHQRTPGPYTTHYPCPVYMSWDTRASLEDKRRRIGRFIGLKGCESPVVVQSEEEIMREVRAQRERRDEAERFAGMKGRWY